jgi:hypothetical protein
MPNMGIANKNRTQHEFSRFNQTPFNDGVYISFLLKRDMYTYCRFHFELVSRLPLKWLLFTPMRIIPAVNSVRGGQRNGQELLS